MQSPERRGAVQGQGIAASPSTSPSALSSHSPAAAAAPSNPKKSRSCAVCRSRKVRCDKLSPCTNCRRAGIACVVPQPDRLPAGPAASTAPPSPATQPATRHSLRSRRCCRRPPRRSSSA
ncbi:RNA polymerase II-specific transcription factor-like protein [Microdochium nivale]|nr:RNA polymerase II-specific transcription factor-like protein [Microdochium nivale]